MDPEIYIRSGLTLAIGLLIGLQRERAKDEAAGIRTFALVALAGYFVGVLREDFGGWLLLSAVLFLAIILTAGNFLGKNRGRGGITTEIASFLVFCIGVYLANAENNAAFAVVVGGMIALLLHYKKPMHRFVKGLEAKDVHVIMLFVLISLVILPVLPNQVFGPFAVINPFEAWLMVVLIVGIGLAGYVAYRVAGSRVGTLLSGFLGGLVSSTATTVSAARLCNGNRQRVTAASLIIMIASAVSVLRVIVEIVAVNRADILQTGPPILTFLAVFAILGFWLYRKRSDEVVHLDPPENPAELKPAIIFGILYVIVLLAVAAGRKYFGEAGLYVVAVISGLTDVDAITLSTAKLIEQDEITTGLGWRVILVAVMANLVFKSGMAGVIGGKDLFLRILGYYGIALAAGFLILFFWP